MADVTTATPELRLERVNTPPAQTWNYLRANDITLTVPNESRKGDVYFALPRLFEGIDCGRILESCVSRRMSSGTVRSYEKLDLEAIARAERDLDEVTRIMATGEEPEEEATAEETSEEPGGWGSFAESLTEAEAEYLRSALGNRLKKKDGSIEDSVNGKALEAIGDTVLEGGSIVEDYREDLEGIL
jgi:hypothetical protein